MGKYDGSKGKLGAGTSKREILAEGGHSNLAGLGKYHHGYRGQAQRTTAQRSTRSRTTRREHIVESI